MYTHTYVIYELIMLNFYLKLTFLLLLSVFLIIYMSDNCQKNIILQ